MPKMNENLTLNEVRSLVAVEWVLREDPELTRDPKVLRGKVGWHSKAR